MAIFHTSVKTFSRRKGQSSIAAAAYRGGLLLADFLTGQQHDYRRRGGVVESFCLAPQGAPSWATDVAELWPAVEAAEKRRDATVAREFEVALPHELSGEQRAELAFCIAETLVARYAFALQASIHSPGTADGLNHHVHLLATTRRIDANGFADKTLELDGGPSGKAQVEWIREMVAATTNAHLAAAGIDACIDHRGLAEQARSAMLRGDAIEAAVLAREPTRHVGKAATALARRGQASDRAQANDEIRLENKERRAQLLDQIPFQGEPMESGSDTRLGTAHGSAGARLGVVIPVPGLEIRGVSGMRLSKLIGADADATPPQQSLPELIEEGIRALAEVAQARADLALQPIRRWLEQARTEVFSSGESRGLRGLVSEVVAKIKAVRNLLMSRARRLMTLSSVERLRDMAEAEWERFTTDHPRPGYWSPSEWTERRTRRLSSLEKRTAELGQARKQASSEALQALDRAIEGHAYALLRRCASAPKAERPAGNSAAPPALGLSGSPKPPRLH